MAINSFQKEAFSAQLDFVADSEDALRRAQNLKKWDRKKKKMVALPVRFFFQSSI